MWQNFKTQFGQNKIIKKSNCDKTQELKLWQNSILTKLGLTYSSCLSCRVAVLRIVTSTNARENIFLCRDSVAVLLANLWQSLVLQASSTWSPNLSSWSEWLGCHRPVMAAMATRWALARALAQGGSKANLILDFTSTESELQNLRTTKISIFPKLYKNQGRSIFVVQCF